MDLSYQYLVHLTNWVTNLKAATGEIYFERHQYDRPIDKFTQYEWNYLIRELQLTKEKSVRKGNFIRG
jgi:hypothetical protein